MACSQGKCGRSLLNTCFECIGYLVISFFWCMKLLNINSHRGSGYRSIKTVRRESKEHGNNEHMEIPPVNDAEGVSPLDSVVDQPLIVVEMKLVIIPRSHHETAV
ncbi:unnamed protein product [Orchesella dallaii]|uniref:Uncharacterized protein n=1 Tax=Orchesella dallaii TaxID=48710 RepID=A0ABP1S7W5_9HEXA